MLDDSVKKAITLEQTSEDMRFSVYSQDLVTDDLMIELVMHLVRLQQYQFTKQLPVTQIESVTFCNAKLSDAGMSILLEFLSAHGATLKSIKLYNNILGIVSQNREIPYML